VGDDGHSAEKMGVEVKLCLRIAPLFAVVALIGSLPALAEEQGPFLGLSVGLSVPFDVTFHDKNGSGTGKVSLGSAAEVSGEFGYTLPSGIMLSLQAAHDDFGAQHTIINGIEYAVLSGGHVTETAVLANVAYEIPYRDNMSWIIGAGAGAAQVSSSVFDGLANRLSGNNTDFAWQLLAGANWAFTPVLRLQVDYRFRSVLGTNHTYGGIPVEFGSLSSQALMLSMRWILVAPP
jgi:opacity protein-like surface antigen